MGTGRSLTLPLGIHVFHWLSSIALPAISGYLAGRHSCQSGLVQLLRPLGSKEIYELMSTAELNATLFVHGKYRNQSWKASHGCLDIRYE